MKIKVCGMRDIENINELTQLKPDLMGFIFYPKSKRYFGGLSIPKLNEDEIASVGVVVNLPYDQLIQLQLKNNFEYIQLHGDESPDYVTRLKSEGIKIIKAFQIDESFEWNTLDAYQSNVEYFLFDTASKQYGGTGNSFDWNLLQNYKLSKGFFLSGGINIQDIAKIKSLQIPMLYGVDINSRFELNPGIKDISLINEFIKGLRYEC